MPAPVPVTLDRTSAVPLYHQLAVQLEAAIADGTLRPGDAFENELALASRLRLSRPTVRRAIAELTAQGLLVRRRGVGTRVATPVTQRADAVNSLYDDLLATGRTPRTQVLRLETGVRHDRAAAALGLDQSARLVYVERLRYADDDPLARLVNWLPPAYADITVDDLQRDGLYALLRARGARPTTGRQTIRARTPSGDDRRLLRLTRGDAVLMITRTTVDPDGVPVEFGEHCYRGDQYAFEATVTIP